MQPRAATALAALVLCVTGCGGGSPKKEPGRVGSPGAPADTAHQGQAFVATYEDGPVDQIRVVRDTDGGVVVEGATGFPDGTRVTVTLLRRNRRDVNETVAATRAVVELGRFTGRPMLAAGGPIPRGRAVVRVLASFAPGQQEDRVLEATANGARFRGTGMKESGRGYSVYESTIEAEL